MESKKALIIAKVSQLVSHGESLFNVKMPNISVRFDLRGRAAGVAGCKVQRLTGLASEFYVRFNVAAMASENDWHHIIGETVAHEIAHSFCQAHPHLGANHNAGWARVCKLLGGRGTRTYSASDMPDSIARLRPITYTTTLGHKIAVTTKIHAKIQSGLTFNTARHQGQLNKSCAYTMSGQPTAPHKESVTTESKPIAKPITTPLPTTGGSKADQVRATIARLKAEVGSQAFERSITWAVTTLGMSSTLARTYVRNNFNKC